jgi:hypothetical protein
MTSLVDLFNPTFLMFLGILVLVVALLVVYFESKMREQNHKIASMLSLVSTLAEDMNGVKMGLNHFAMVGGHNPNVFIQENLGNNGSNKLIEVSDDEESEEDEEEKSEDEGSEKDEEEKSDDDEGSDDDMYDDSDSSEDEEGENDGIKIIKLQVSNEDAEDDHSYDEADNLHFENHEDLNEELDEFNMNDEIPEIANDYVEEILSLKYDETPTENTHLEVEESKIPSTSELKTISINLGDDVHDETIDYKKLQLPKLRSIVVEKGLATNVEASKLKKPELLKLLGAE